MAPNANPFAVRQAERPQYRFQGSTSTPEIEQLLLPRPVSSGRPPCWSLPSRIGRAPSFGTFPVLSLQRFQYLARPVRHPGPQLKRRIAYAVRSSGALSRSFFAAVSTDAAESRSHSCRRLPQRKPDPTLTPCNDAGLVSHRRPSLRGDTNRVLLSQQASSPWTVRRTGVAVLHQVQRRGHVRSRLRPRYRTRNRFILQRGGGVPATARGRAPPRAHMGPARRSGHELTARPMSNPRWRSS